jgi:hypothetical protein
LASRQILVTHVGAASPADGVVKVDDVILGVEGRLFNDDARKSLALAIQEAETAAQGGVLKLMVSRGGQVQELALKLAVMGSYSDTAPWNCAKSKRILDEACKVLEKEEPQANWTGSIQGLALLATGNRDYLPKLRDFARKLAAAEVDPDKNPEGTNLGRHLGAGLPQSLPLRVFPGHPRPGGAARDHQQHPRAGPRPEHVWHLRPRLCRTDQGWQIQRLRAALRSGEHGRAAREPVHRAREGSAG